MVTFAEDFIGAIMQFNLKDNPVPAERYFYVSTGRDTAQMLEERLQKHSLASRSREWVPKEAKSSGDLTLEEKIRILLLLLEAPRHRQEDGN